MDQTLVTLALGGNAILRRGGKGTFEEQYQSVSRTAAMIADLIEKGYKVVITHGNGPQVGATLLRHDAAKQIIPPFPLDACGAETQGLIGYMIQQGLRNELKERGLGTYVVAVVTRVIVDKDDSAFRNPTKPVGPFYSKDEADKLGAAKREWVIKEDAGRGYRRVVPSPDPKIIAERYPIKCLVDNGYVVVAAGGGGIPIVEENGRAEGIEAVIDKDLGGQRLATFLGASVFAMLTDVKGAYLNYGKHEQQLIQKMTAEKLKQYLSEGHFKSGSMKPKVLAAIRFVENGGSRAVIAHLEDLLPAVEGKAGTQVYMPQA
jgi:carbamate kinase